MNIYSHTQKIFMWILYISYIYYINFYFPKLPDVSRWIKESLTKYNDDVVTTRNINISCQYRCFLNYFIEICHTVIYVHESIYRYITLCDD